MTGQKYGQLVTGIIDKLDTHHLLDYGCGSNLSLRETLTPAGPLRYQAYDPGVPQYSGDPVEADMVVCIDVLEHIESEYLEDVLDHIEALTGTVLFASIHMGPAGKTLDDGRNAHLTQKPMEWWLPKIWDRFTIQTVQLASPAEFWVIATAAHLPVAA